MKPFSFSTAPFSCSILRLHLTLARAEEGTFQIKADDPAARSRRTNRSLRFDAVGERLFVCALGNNTVEVIDLNKAERVHTISGLGAPQGVAFAPELNRLLVANDKGGVCNIYDADSFQTDQQSGLWR